MRRLTVLIFLLAAAPAQAAPLNELPFRQLPRDQNATCLRATGTASGLAMYAPRATDVFDGMTMTARVPLGRLTGCAATAAAGGAAVLAAPVGRPGERVRVHAALREPGGAFGAPAELGAVDPEQASVAAAMAPTGDAVIAWMQGRGERHRVVAARRRPGGAFGAVEPLTPWRRQGKFSEGWSVTAGMSATGIATVAWALPRPDRRGAELLLSVGTAQAAPGGRFRHQALAPKAQEVNRVALAVAPDGWALLAYDDTSGVHALERAPGADRFSVAFVDLPDEEAFDAGMPVVAVRNGGGGLVAWRSSAFQPGAAVVATTRPAAGAFPAPRTVAPDTFGDDSGFGAGTVLVETVGGAGAGPVDLEGGILQAALAPDGRALLAWARERQAVMRAAVVSGTLATGFAAPVTVSGPLRDVSGVVPLLLEDGRAAVAWTDNATSFAFPVGQGRMHLAVESAPAIPEPERPRVTVTAPAQRLYDSEPVHLRVHCDRACDVRAMLAASSSEPPAAEAHSLRRAGTLPLDLSRLERSVERRRIRIRVRAGAPNAREVVSLSRRVLVVRRPPLPVPPVVDVRAVRRGGSIVVTWRTAFAARRTYFAVLGQRTRKLEQDAITDLGSVGSAPGGGRTRFRVRLQPERPETVRWVGVYAFSFDRTRGHRAVVPVR
ncbi:MAG TPA: hypothetical protein VFX51_21795 [Solirubrobacteraceae bacterium]|nr:hypothetical protein [Solirubrobacteraceae bacterium]